MILKATVGGDFKPHPEGIHPGVCVDLIELGLLPSEYMGTTRWLNKLRLVFETEQRSAEGKNLTLSKTFTASLGSQAKLTEFLGKWRGRPIVPGEMVDLDKVIGACCTLVVSHQVNREGRTVASIDAVSKPTKHLVPSGGYDPVMARQRIAEWKAKMGAPAGLTAGNPKAEIRNPTAAPAAPPSGPVAAAVPQQAAAAPKSPAPVAAPSATADYDPEVGF